MSAINVLRNEYPGDLAWANFVTVFRPAWDLWPDKTSFCLSIGDEDFAIVLSSLIGTHALDWFVQPCGALSKRAPIEILKNEPAGFKIIRTLLMRMPC